MIEGDEYDSAYFDKTAKFLKYLPDIAVVNNIEFDHADIYADLDAVRLAFRRLVNLVPRPGLTLLGIDSPDAAALAPLARSRVQTFGLAAGADWRALDRRSRRRRTPRSAVRCAAATISARSRCRCWASTTSATRWPRSPSAPTRAATRHAAPTGWRHFKGVKRRLEVVGDGAGVTVYDDFAHHPTAVAETLRARPARVARPPHLGDLRAALGVVLPARLSGRLCARVCRRDEVVIASVFRSTLPRGRAVVREPARRRPAAPRASPPATCRTSMRLSRPSPPRRAPATSSWSCPMAASAAFTASSCERLGDENSGACRRHDAAGRVRAGDRSRSSTNASIALAARLRSAASRASATSCPATAPLGVHFDPLQTDLARARTGDRRRSASSSRPSSRCPSAPSIEIRRALRRR